MTRDEFINTCVMCGYASKKTATAYADTHPSLTDADYIEVWRQSTQTPCAWMERLGTVQGVQTTKRYARSNRDMREEDNR